jgi:1-acyl-sn-glycerol-3-phosphate acyltransferase
MKEVLNTPDDAEEPQQDPEQEVIYPPNGMGDILISLGMWTAGLTWLGTVLGSLIGLQMIFPADRLEWLNRLYCRGQIKLTGSKWRAVVHPSVDPKRVYMFCQNHINHFDHTTIYNATPHFKQGIEAIEHFKFPVYGYFMKQRGTIAVRRGSQGQTPEIMQHMRNEMAKGHSMLAFPEGTRSKDGRIGPFRKGLFYIARDLGIPIVPTAVTGAQHVLHKGSLVMRPGHEIVVYCDEPVETAGLTDEQIPELIERVRGPMVKRVDDYHAEFNRKYRESDR